MFSYPVNCGKLFQSFTIKHDVVCGIFVDVFYQTKKLPIFSVYVRTHTLWKSVGIYQMWLICYYVDDHVVNWIAGSYSDLFENVFIMF